MIDDFQDAALGRALKRRKELQETIRRAVQELEKLEDWLKMYRDLSTDISDNSKGAELSAPQLRSDAFAGAQALFENLVLSVLREAGRPMKSPEIVQEFRRRGHPLSGNEIRTAWNRLWAAKAKGILTNEPGLGYWIAGEPLSDEAKQKALVANKSRPKSGVAAIIKAARGTKKGRDPIWGADEVATAERMFLDGRSRAEVAAALGGVSQGMIQKHFPGGIQAFLKEKYPDAVIPKRTYVHRPPRPGHKPTGRPRTVTPEQEAKMGELRSQGMSHTEIAVAMKMKRSTVSSYLTQFAKTQGSA